MSISSLLDVCISFDFIRGGLVFLSNIDGTASLPIGSEFSSSFSIL